MKSWTNFFLLIGVAAIVVMLFTFEVSYEELWNKLCMVNYWCIGVFAIWFVIYGMNTVSWRIIIRGVRNTAPQTADNPYVEPSFMRLYGMTVSGFALNYTTPVGLMGGEPYRIMALSPYVGTTRATSSVSLFAMTHIFSHFWFWVFSIILYLFVGNLNSTGYAMLGLFALFCTAGLLLILRGYRKGLAVRAVRWCTHIPLIKRRMRNIYESKIEALRTVDKQIASLQLWRLVAATSWEFTARIVGCLEIYFVLITMTDQIDFFDCIFIQAFTSLFANLLFFIPLQVGTREYGFLMTMGKLGSQASEFALCTSLITRVRELIWIAIGMVLLKLPSKK